MPRPYFRSIEQAYLDAGDLMVAGFDEAGRGCLAGPLSMAAVIYDPILKKAKGLNDSKLVSVSKRHQLFEFISNKVTWAHTFVDVDIIDHQGLTAALKHGFNSLITDLEQQTSQPLARLLIDGKQKWDLRRPSESIIGGDSKVRAIAAASIIAKVKRDRLMELLDAEFGGYGFAKHVGYGTRQHRDALKKLGPTGLHRLSFAPVKALLE